MAGQRERPMKNISEAFEGLAFEGEDLDLGQFARACSLISSFFGILSIFFKFIELDFVTKVQDLVETSKTISSLPSMIDKDMEKKCVRKPGSHSRNLLIVNRGLKFIKVLYEQALTIKDDSLMKLVFIAYEQVFAPYHNWDNREGFTKGLNYLPPLSQFMMLLNEDVDSAHEQMRSYITSSGPVIQYIDELFLSRELGIDW